MPTGAMAALAKFTIAHPKFTAFLRKQLTKKFEEGTVIEITVTRPNAQAETSNIKLSASDLALFESLKSMAPQG